MDIKILGSGCINCKKLYEMVKEVIDEKNIDSTIEKVEDFKDIMKYGVMRTPALVINGKVKVSGRVPAKSEIIQYIQEE